MKAAKKTVELFDKGPFETTDAGEGVKRPGIGGAFITQEERDTANTTIKEGKSRIRELEILNEQKSSDILNQIKRGDTIGDPSAHRFSGTKPGEWTVKAIPIKRGRIIAFDKVDKYRDLIEKNAKEKGLDTNFIRSLINQESGGDPEAKSPETDSGFAYGLMQILPSTARKHGLKKGEKLTDPAVNIRVGTNYLKFLHDKFGGNEELMLSGYHSGERDAVAALGNPKGNPKTHNYIGRVRGYLDYLRDIEAPDISQDPSTRGVPDTSVRTNVDPNIEEKINRDIQEAFLDPNETRENRDRVLAGLRAKNPDNALIGFLISAGRGAGLDFSDNPSAIKSQLKGGR